MKIDKLTLGEIKQLKKMFHGDQGGDFQSPHLNKKCIIRCDRSGVFYGTLKALHKKHAIVEDAIRIWYWAGAASLSQLAVDGTSKPGDCKFAVRVSSLELTDCLETIPAENTAQASIEGVASWKK